jgi:hypothetical protein
MLFRLFGSALLDLACVKPDRLFDCVRIIASGDFVSCHFMGHQVFSAGDPGGKAVAVRGKFHHWGANFTTFRLIYP